jgi:phosphoribosyl 1,2-cyclic phosphodiesterase
MSGRFTVLASGSTGNAALLETDGFGLLIDCGIHPRTLTNRLREIGSGWGKVSAVILTHTHGDHWKDDTLADLRSRNIPVYAHTEHFEQLSTCSNAYGPLLRAKLTRTFDEDRPFELVAGLVVRPIRVSHDADPTFAFRFNKSDSRGSMWSVGYASDLGCASEQLVEALAGVDVLALEYNHDVKLERRSRRPTFLIDRVLSDYGHLSNDQAAELTTAIAARSGEVLLSHLFQLHLSRECNRPELAAEAGSASLAKLSPATTVITARQDMATKPIELIPRRSAAKSPFPRPVAPAYAVSRISFQPSLPGFDT